MLLIQNEENLDYYPSNIGSMMSKFVVLVSTLITKVNRDTTATIVNRHFA